MVALIEKRDCQSARCHSDVIRKILPRREVRFCASGATLVLSHKDIQYAVGAEMDDAPIVTGWQQEDYQQSLSVALEATVSPPTSWP